jgi:cytochrome c-type biogenesis protein CcmH
MRWIVCFLFLLVSQLALAVQPDEIMSDPALEARARAISHDLRCLVCQNQSIDDSAAPLARDLRLLVREQLAAGRSDQQVVDYIVQRYGEFVLLKPRFEWRTALLWLTPLLVIIFGAAGIFISFVRRRTAVPEAAEELSPAEKSRLEQLTARLD